MQGDYPHARIHAYVSGQVDYQAVVIEGVAQQLRRLRKMERRRRAMSDDVPQDAPPNEWGLVRALARGCPSTRRPTTSGGRSRR